MRAVLIAAMLAGTAWLAVAGFVGGDFFASFSATPAILPVKNSKNARPPVCIRPAPVL